MVHPDAKRILYNQVKEARRLVSDWTERLEENPAWSLEWASDIFTAAAKIKVYTQVLKLLNSDDMTDEQVIESARRETVRMAKSLPYRSTSTTHNLIKEEEAAAWASALDTMEIGF